MSEVESFSIEGSAGPEEERIVIAAIERMLLEEESARHPSRWKMAGRAAAVRRGAVESRSGLRGGAWRQSLKMNWSSQPAPDFHGRGETK